MGNTLWCRVGSRSAFYLPRFPIAGAVEAMGNAEGVFQGLWEGAPLSGAAFHGLAGSTAPFSRGRSETAVRQYQSKASLMSLTPPQRFCLLPMSPVQSVTHASGLYTGTFSHREKALTTPSLSHRERVARSAG